MVELLNTAIGGASQIGSRIHARFQGNSTKGRKMDIQASIQPIPNMLSSSFPFLLRLRRIATSAAAFSRFMLNRGSISFSFIGAYKSWTGSYLGWNPSGRHIKICWNHAQIAKHPKTASAMNVGKTCNGKCSKTDGTELGFQQILRVKASSYSVVAARPSGQPLLDLPAVMNCPTLSTRAPLMIGRQAEI